MYTEGAMTSIKRLETPLTQAKLKKLRVGQRILISGFVYTARDAAHKRLTDAIDAKENLPIPIDGQIIYYAGPSPTRPGEIIGSAGPTTATRVDVYTPKLLTNGLKGMIGKGYRTPEVRMEMQKHGAVYFVTVGGAAALISQTITEVKIIAYEDLGTEAIRRLRVEDFPVLVANDLYGDDLFESGRNQYKREQ